MHIISSVPPTPPRSLYYRSYSSTTCSVRVHVLKSVTRVRWAMGCAEKIKSDKHGYLSTPSVPLQRRTESLTHAGSLMHGARSSIFSSKWELTLLLARMSILEYNGGAIIAMAGKNCVGICSDSRLGMQAQTVAKDFQKVFEISDKVFVGLAGLATDVITLNQSLKYKTNMYRFREHRDMKPETFSAMLSQTLYEKRFGPWFCEPVVAGLSDDDKPFISGMDLIGAPVFTDDFVVSGTCTANLHGMCESMYRPDMNPEELFEVLAQCLLSAVDRDAISGWGAVVHIITPDGVLTRTLKCRQD